MTAPRSRAAHAAHPQWRRSPSTARITAWRRRRAVALLLIATLALAATVTLLACYWTSSHAPSPTRSSHQLTSYGSSQSSGGSGRGEPGRMFTPRQHGSFTRPNGMGNARQRSGAIAASTHQDMAPTTVPPSRVAARSTGPTHPTVDVQLGLTVTKYQQWTRVVFEEGVAANEATAIALAAQQAQESASAAAARITSTPTGTSSPPMGGSSNDAAPLSFGLFPCIAQAESGGNASDTSGLYGLLVSTWQSLGYSGVPGDAPISEQNAAALILYNEYGYSPWNDSCTGR